MTDYSPEEVLDGTVDEVRDRIEESEDLDLEELLEKETDGKDRKTVKEFIERQMDSEEVSEEAVEEIDEETSGGLLGGYSRSSVLIGGALLGLIIGLVIGMASGYGGASAAPPQKVADDVGSLVSGGSFNGTVDVSSPVRTHGMYFMNVSITRPTANQTTTQTQGVYTTLDGSLLFPVISQFGQQQSPIALKKALQQSQGTNSTQ